MARHSLEPPVRAGHRRRRWVALGVAALVVLTGYGVALRSAPVTDAGAPFSPLGPVASPPAGVPAVRTLTGPPVAAAPLPVADTAPDLGAVQNALDAHATAMLARRARAALPVTDLAYAVSGVEGDDQTATVSATLSYRLRGEATVVRAPVEVGLVRARGGWQVRDEAGTQHPLPWDVGRLTVATGSRTTVVGVGAVPGGRAALRWWAEAGDRAAQAVRRSVRRWDGRLTVVVPPDAATLARLTGRSTASVTQLAGLALAEPVAAGDSPVVRVYLNPDLLAGASDLARRIVLRHEAAHVALGAPATGQTPTWLEEGMAEELGYRGSGVPLPVAVRDLLAQVRAGEVPDAPPASGDFSGPSVAVAYQSAHLLVATMVERVGLAGALRVYRLTAADGDLAGAWREVSGTGWPRLLGDWQRELRAFARS